MGGGGVVGVGRVGLKSPASHTATTWLAQLGESVGRAPVCRAGGRGVQTLARPTLRVFKQLRRKCCLCNDICKWLDFLFLSDKDEKL